MATVKSDKPRGILNPTAAQRNFEHARYVPSPDIAYFVEHYWIVRWDLRGQEPRLAETLPHPSIHLTIEENLSRIVGVMKGKFSRTLENQGRVFGVKFRPGAFYAFTKLPVSRLTDTIVPLHEIFGEEGDLLAEEIVRLDEDSERIERTEAFLRRCLPERDEMIETINRIVACIIADREIIKVEDVSSRFDLNIRTLQRLFSRYVGVSPKWVIRRYRLHEAVEQLASGTIPDWPKIALDLGYFDQAHFIKDFKALVGLSPAEYYLGIRAASRRDEGNP